MSLIKLTIKGISNKTQNGAYVLILTEMDGPKTLPIIIGTFEAQSIAIALEKEFLPPRPLTHDLIKTFSELFSITVKKIIIHELVDGVFFSSLVCERKGVQKIIDARTSDAVAIAVRFQAPIYTHKNILDKAGVYLKTEEVMLIKKELDIDTDTDTIKNVSFSNISLSELNKRLKNAVIEENYELAAKIRDEISKRSM